MFKNDDRQQTDTKNKREISHYSTFDISLDDGVSQIRKKLP